MASFYIGRGEKTSHGRYIDNEHLFDVYVKKYVPAAPVPEPVPVVVPPAPEAGGWLNYADNTYTKDGDVYTISTPNHLASIMYDLATSADNFANKTIKLANDINLSGDIWNVKDEGPAFAGTFDGQGHTIKNMYVADPALHVGGLFYAVCGNGVVQNLHVEGVVSCDMGVGGIAYINDGTIKDSSFNGTLASTNANYFGAGGITYNNLGTITNCTTNVEMTCTGDANSDAYGGIAAWNSGTIDGCTSNGTMALTTGSPTNVSNIFAGGIAGVNCKGDPSSIPGVIKNSESRVSEITVTVGGKGLPIIGGIAAQNGERQEDANVIEGCKSYGRVPASDGTTVISGGVVGINFEAATVRNCGWLEGTAAKGVAKNVGTETGVAAFTGGSGVEVITGGKAEETPEAIEPEFAPDSGLTPSAPQTLTLSTQLEKYKDELADVSLTTDSAGNAIVDTEAIINKLPGNIDAKGHGIVPLPLYIADLGIAIPAEDEVIPFEQSGNMAALGSLVAIETTLNNYEGAAPSRIALLKVLKDSDIRPFKWAKTATEVGDGEFFIAADAKGAAVSGNIKADTKYYVFIGVKDNGTFDLDPAVGSILDPTVLALTSGAAPDDGGSRGGSGGGSGGGGGCNAGFGGLLLLAAVPFVVRRKK